VVAGYKPSKFDLTADSIRITFYFNHASPSLWSAVQSHLRAIEKGPDAALRFS
jgi:hypothetical protein